MLSRPKPLHLKKATSLKMNGTLLLKWLVAFCVLDGVAASAVALAAAAPVWGSRSMRLPVRSNHRGLVSFGRTAHCKLLPWP